MLGSLARSEPVLLLATEPGLTAWRAVVGEFRRTLDDPLAGWPVLAAIAGGLLLVWVNIRLARKLIDAAEHEIELHSHRDR